jgi:hypothetical protein
MVACKFRQRGENSMNREEAYKRILDIVQEKESFVENKVQRFHSGIKLSNGIIFEFFGDSLLTNFGRSQISLYYNEIEDIRMSKDEDGLYIDGLHIRYFFVSFEKGV